MEKEVRKAGNIGRMRYGPCLFAGLFLLFSSCYSPDFNSGITSVYFNIETILIPRVPGDNWSAEVTLVLALRPSLAWESASIVWDVFEPTHGWLVEFDNPDPVFDEDGTARGIVVLDPLNSDLDYASFTVQARVIEPGPENRQFLALAQIEVVKEGDR